MILCCGEALIDMIPAPTISGPDGFVPHAGGAIFNTAIALGRLGSEVGMFTGLSSDLFGAQLRAGLKASTVDTSLIVTSDLPTTLAFVRLVDGQASYTFYDENSAGRSLTAQDLPDLPDSINALYFGGISLCSEPGADAYLALAQQTGADRVIMLDPNIRPGFISDEARYRARLQRMIALAGIVKVSGEDLDWIYADGRCEVEKAERLRAAGPTVVILTQGSEGAVALTNGAAPIRIAAQKATVVDTVAAGDTFNGGFLARLDQLDVLSRAGIAEIDSATLEDAMGYAAKAAAVTVSRSGANPPWAAEMQD